LRSAGPARHCGQAPRRPRPTRHPHPIHLPRPLRRPDSEHGGFPVRRLADLVDGTRGISYALSTRRGNQRRRSTGADQGCCCRRNRAQEPDQNVRSNREEIPTDRPSRRRMVISIRERLDGVLWSRLNWPEETLRVSWPSSRTPTCLRPCSYWHFCVAIQFRRESVET